MLCAESVRTAHNTHFTTNQWADDYVRFELEMKSSGKITISVVYEWFFFWLRLRVLLHVLHLCAICCGRMCVRACVEWPIYKLLISYQTCFSSLCFLLLLYFLLTLTLSHWCKAKRPCGTFMLRCENMQWIFSVFIRNTLTLTQLFVSKFSFDHFFSVSSFFLSFFIVVTLFFLKFSNGNFFRQYVGLSD